MNDKKENVSFDSVLCRFLECAFHKLKIDNKEEHIKGLVQFIKFGLVGVSNTLISYLLNISALLLLKRYNLRWDYIAANLFAFFTSVLWSFYWNNKYVFKPENGKKRSFGRTLIKTYLSYAFTGIVLSNVLSYLWIDLLGISKYFAPIMNLIITVPTNYLLNKKWAFK